MALLAIKYSALPIAHNSHILKNNIIFFIFIFTPFSAFKAQNAMKKTCAETPYFFYNLLTGTTVYYKSRGGEWSAPLGASRIFICVGRLFKHK